MKLTLAVALALASNVAGAEPRPLEVYWIDVEGGGATLVVTPAGESLLIDTGNPGGRDSGRILSVARDVAGLRGIDHVVVTHLHRDHFGGAAELAERLPVGTLYENGIDAAPERERSRPEVAPYRSVKAERRVVVQPGQTLPLSQAPGAAPLRVRVLAARQAFAPPEGARPNEAVCRGATERAPDASDNANSIAILLEMGPFRFFDGGDLTWNVEGRLVCPEDRVGSVDVYQSDHHGLDTSNNPVLVRTLQPRVVVFNNGPRKGYEPQSVAAVRSTPSVEAVYQVHRNLREGAANAEGARIANDEEACQGHYVKMTVAPAGDRYALSVPSKEHRQEFATRLVGPVPAVAPLPVGQGRGIRAVSLLDLASLDRERVLDAADRYLSEGPVTVTASRAPRSAGGPHDYHSEADYWWPDPANPDGPYVQRDGQSNPGNFDDHRRAMRRLSLHVPALAAAWKLTGERRYAEHAGTHLRAWFVDEATRMAPHLLYSQAIRGRVTGRGIGVIDTIHLVEVARAVETLDAGGALPQDVARGVRDWFAQYVEWMTTHRYGIDEREAKNNHGTCWVMQVAAFARLTGNDELLAYSRDRFKTVLVPNQMAADGSFPLELRRTKPYGYSLFNLEAMATAAWILSTPEDDLWRFELPDGRGLRKAVEYLAPFIRDKKSWPLAPDVMYHDRWPMRQAALLFAGLALGRPEYVELWKGLPADSDVEEVVRNFFVRQPLLWVD